MGHPVLPRRTPPLDPTDVGSPAVQQLIDDMFETMNEYAGIGLAAPQVHQSLRLFVAGVDDPDGCLPPMMMMMNPEIEPLGMAEEDDWEGCLGITDIRGRMPRSVEIRVRSLARHGAPQRMTANGFAARVIRHETDHLDGVLFVDRMRSFDSLTFLTEYELVVCPRNGFTSPAYSRPDRRTPDFRDDSRPPCWGHREVEP